MALAFERCRPRVVVRERCSVPRDLVDIDRVRSDLTVYPTGNNFGGTREGSPSVYHLFEETDTHVVVPRAYPVRLKGVAGVDYDVTSLVGPRSRVPWRDLVMLGPHQWQRFDQRPGFEALLSPGKFDDLGPLNPLHGGRTFVLRCGGGKTAIALKGAAARGGRFLWVTVTEALVDQVRGRRRGSGSRATTTTGDITRYLDVPYDEIGHVQGDKQKWRGYACAVATLQTLAVSTKVDDAFWDYWDLVIFDEGDVLGAPAFNRVVSRFRGERWVLTATPRRNDRLEKLFLLQTGPVCYEHTEFDLVPSCYFFATKARESNLVTYGWDPYRRKPRVQYALTAKNLLVDEERTSLILDKVEKALNANRTILVTGGSIEGMALMRQRAVQRKIDALLVTSGTKGRDRYEAIHLPPVVFATERIFARGIDRVTFDTLVLASLTTVNPVLMQQLPGRILRFNPEDVAKKPIVLVPVDVQIEALLAMSAKLAWLFHGKHWPVDGIASQLMATRRKPTQW